MLKRITYISTATPDFYPSDIIEIGETSEKNNKRDGITGALFCFKDIFYQILEGASEKVDACFERISKDKRHKEVFILEIKDNISKIQYPNWSMKTVKLDDSTESIISPLRSILDVITKTHNILRKFTSSTILQDIQKGENPLERKFQNNNRVVVFSDIYKSTSFSENLDIDKFSHLLDAYYKIVIGNFVKFGGTISKLTGDGVMVYFPETELMNAILSCLASLSDLHEYRNSATGAEKLLYAGFGVNFGPVLEGNIGSNLRKDYTLIGECVNTAAHLETMTRKVGWSILFRNNVAEQINSNANIKVKKIGLYQPKGRKETEEIFTIDDPAAKCTIQNLGEKITNLN